MEQKQSLEKRGFSEIQPNLFAKGSNSLTKVFYDEATQHFFYYNAHSGEARTYSVDGSFCKFGLGCFPAIKMVLPKEFYSNKKRAKK